MMRFIHNLSLGLVAFREQAKAEKAYIGNFWFGALSRLAYNLMFLLFIDVLFQRIGAVAGYSKNDFLFMFFVSQIGFYIAYMGIFSGMLKLVESVRNGNFDLLLLKPVPHRFFLYVRGFMPYELMFTFMIMLPMIGFFINWDELSINTGSFLLGALVWVGGLVICNTLMFALALPVFKYGDATNMLNMFYSITAINQLPYGKLPLVMKALSLSLLPQLIFAAATAEVMLQKGDTITTVLSVCIATIVSITLYQFMWRYALKHYTSASS